MVVESDGSPGAFVGADDVRETRIGVDVDGRPCTGAPPNSRVGLRIRLDRTPATAASLDAADAEGVAIAAGEVLRLGGERAASGCSPSGQGNVPGAPGSISAVGALRREIGRQRRIAWLVCAALVLGLAGGGYALLRSARREEDDARRRLDEQRARLELEVAADRDRVKRSFDLLDERFAQSLERVQARLSEKMDASRHEVGAELERQRRATDAELSKLATNERERFGALLDRYRGSVLLLYVSVRYPGIRLPGDDVLRQGFYGTGWVARADGLVVTNKHVVEPWKFDADIQGLLASVPGSRIEPNSTRGPPAPASRGRTGACRTGPRASTRRRYRPFGSSARPLTSGFRRTWNSGPGRSGLGCMPRRTPISRCCASRGGPSCPCP